jgi:hypothetical protein
MTADGVAWAMLFPLFCALSAGNVSGGGGCGDGGGGVRRKAAVSRRQGPGTKVAEIRPHPAMMQAEMRCIACYIVHGEGAPVAVTRPKAH